MRLNTLTDIASLPPEMLAEIFMQLIDSFVGDGTYRNEFAPKVSYSWIVITYVCRYWRDVALGTPALWQNIIHRPVCKQDGIQEMLARSKHASLAIRIATKWYPDPKPVSEELKAIFKQMHRARTIHINAYAHELAALKNEVPARMPYLTSLALRPIDEGRIPSLFDRCDMPRLRRLTLSKCQIDSSHPVLNRFLAKLVIEDRIPPDVLLILQSRSELQHVELSGDISFPNYSTTELPTFRERINMQHLTVLRLAGSLQFVVYVLDNLILPSTTSVEILVSGFPYGPNITTLASTIGSRLKAQVKRQPIVEIRSIACWCRPHRESHDLERFVMDLYTNMPAVDTLGGMRSTPHIRLSFLTSKSTFTPTMLIDLILTRLPLSTTSSLFLGNICIDSLRRSSWVKLLGKLSKVTTLRVKGRSANELDQLLKSIVEAPAEPNKTRRRMQWLLPKLETLMVEEAAINADLSQRVATPEWVKSFVKVLQARTRPEVFLKHLSFARCCGLSDQTLTSIRAGVKWVDVRWDGMDRGHQNESL